MSSPDTLELVNILKLHNQLGSTHGNAFLKAFALHLSRTFDADYVLIGKVEPDNQQITTLVFTHNSEFISNMTYAIEGTPCQNALHNDVCIHLDQAHELYPQDDFFIQENIVGYIGAALFDENNKQIGIVNASFKRPIHSIGPAMLTLMKSFSGRLASEMIGLLREAELQNLNKELQEAIASREAKSQVVGVLSHQIKILCLAS